MSRAGAQDVLRRMRERAERLGLNRRQLADRLGVDPKSIRNWETGKHPPSPERMATIEAFIRQPAPKPEPKKVQPRKKTGKPKPRPWIGHLALVERDGSTSSTACGLDSAGELVLRGDDWWDAIRRCPECEDVADGVMGGLESPLYTDEDACAASLAAALGVQVEGVRGEHRALVEEVAKQRALIDAMRQAAVADCAAELVELAGMPRCGDTVVYRGSGERWLVAWATAHQVCATGWGARPVLLDEVVLVERASDAEHRDAVAWWRARPNNAEHRPVVLALYDGEF